MEISKDLKVLVVSAEMVKTGKGELFHCLAGLDRVWHADLANALEMFVETAEDGWDAVIIDSHPIMLSASIAKEMDKSCPEQEIIILYDAFTCVEDFGFAIGVPRTPEALQGILEHQIGLVV